jgi:hypothetical protein
MIINLKHKTDLITLDLNIKQIRYLKNHFKDISGYIDFIDLETNDIIGLTYLYHKDIKTFNLCIKDIIKNNLYINLTSGLKVL